MEQWRERKLENHKDLFSNIWRDEDDRWKQVRKNFTWKKLFNNVLWLLN